jgi:acyl-CoA thioester hydrolase
MLQIKNTHQLYVRYAETDKMSVVYNVNYYIYFETGRNEIMRANNMSLSDYEENDNIYFPLIDSYAKFHTPAHYDDLLTIETTMTYDGSIVFKFEYIIKRAEEIICTGYTRHCFISQKNMKPARPPQRFIDALTQIK